MLDRMNFEKYRLEHDKGWGSLESKSYSSNFEGVQFTCISLFMSWPVIITDHKYKTSAVIRNIWAFKLYNGILYSFKHLCEYVSYSLYLVNINAYEAPASSTCDLSIGNYSCLSEVLKSTRVHTMIMNLA